MANVSQHSYIAGDASDLANDTPPFTAEDVSHGVVLAASGNPTTKVAPIGAKQSLAAPTSISAIDKAATSGTITVSYTEDGAGTAVDILVVEGSDAVRGTFVSRTEDAASPVDIAGLTDDTEYTVYLRTVDADGRYGPWSAGTEVTPTAS